MKLLPHPSTTLPSWRRKKARAALPERLAFIDLKGPKIPFKVFKQLLTLYSRWGISGVLVEYEHRLPELPWHRQFPKPDRYTSSEIAELTRLSCELGLDFIPLVQTLGHVEFLRRLPGTARLMENPTYPNQLCPSKPAVRKYLSQLVAYICKLHPNSPRIHIGLDETQQLGRCPTCKKRAEKLGGKLELYLDHVRWMTSEVLRHGRAPMMWGDMFLNPGRESLISKLDPRITVMPWDYGCTTNRVPYVLYKGNRPCKAAFRNDYTCETFPSALPIFPAEGRFADNLSATELRRLGGLDKTSGLAHGFVQGRVLAKLKHPLWGVCAADMSASGPFRPNFVRGLHNCNQVVRILLELHGQGAIATSWARGHSFAPINSMWPLGLYVLAQFAASGWSGKTSPADLKRRAPEIAAELGMPVRIGDWTLDDLLWILSNPSTLDSGGKAATFQTVLDLLKKSKVHGTFAEGLMLSIDLEIQWQQLLFLLVETRWWRPNQDIVPPSICAEMKSRLKTILRNIDRLKPKARRYYTSWVGEKNTFETWWRGLFEVDSAVALQTVK